jgi:hypothetical protein
MYVQDVPWHGIGTRLFRDGTGQHLDGAQGTRWGLLNAVTEYVDHQRPINGQLDTMGHKTPKLVDRRMEQAWFGFGAKYKQNAWNLLVPNADELAIAGA